jgi:hypothetical protein
VHRWSKNRALTRMGTLASLGLALCVFTWGLQYKLSLYDPPQAPSHQIPTAKLLSKDEQSEKSDSLPTAGRGASARLMHTAASAVFFIFLPAVFFASPAAPPQREQQAKRPWRVLCRAFVNNRFDRPPPALI